MTPSQQFHELLAEVRPEVERHLQALWEEASGEHAHHGPAVARPLAAARELCLRGGKRLRAALVAAGYRLGAKSRDWSPAVPVCSAVELLQAYFLIHDDWMDRDRVRRGGPSVHAALEPHVRSAHVAACGAVLAGDYTLALATRAFSRVEVAGERFPALLARFAQLQLDAIVGQQLDVLGDGENLDEVYRLKTASYTVVGPLELGFELGAGARPAHAALEAFAVPLGIAFQLRDDLIGAFAADDVSGKPRGSDLRSGKHTLLLETALRLADGATERTIRAAFGCEDADAAAVSAALAAIEASGARNVVEQRIEALSQKAALALESPDFEPEMRQLLEGIRSAMIERER